MVSQLAVAGSVEDKELGLMARGGVVIGAEAVFEGFEIGRELAECCLRRLAGVGYRGLAIGELWTQVLVVHSPTLKIRADFAYGGQKGGLSSTARSQQKNGGKLFRSGFAVEEVVEEDGQGYADQEGDEDRRYRRREGPSRPAVVPGAIERHVGGECRLSQKLAVVRFHGVVK